MSKNMSKTVLVLLVLAAAVFSAFAEGNAEAAKGPAKSVTLEYWTIFTGPDGKFMQNLVDQFNREYEGKIKVNMSVIPQADYYVKMPIAIQSGKGPDAGIIHLDQLKRFMQQGILLPLDDVKESLGVKDGDVLPVAWQAAQSGGKQYALPLDVHPLVFFWNKKLFREAGLDPNTPPKNREEFLAFAKKLTKPASGTAAAQWGTAIPVGWPNFQIWYSVFFSNGGELFTADMKTATFGSPEGLDAAQFLVDLTTKHKVSPANVQVDADVDMFKRGTCAMEFNGIWMLDAYKNTAGLEFGAAPIPQLGSKKPAEWAGSHTMVVFKQKSPDKAREIAAGTLLSFISQKSLEWAKAGQIPARLAVQQSADFQQLPYMKDLAAGAPTIVFPDLFPRYGDATGPVWEALNKVLVGGTTVPAAFEEGVKKANSILSE